VKKNKPCKKKLQLTMTDMTTETKVKLKSKHLVQNEFFQVNKTCLHNYSAAPSFDHATAFLSHWHSSLFPTINIKNLKKIPFSQTLHHNKVC
jgi:hypothetical protein